MEIRPLDFGHLRGSFPRLDRLDIHVRFPVQTVGFVQSPNLRTLVVRHIAILEMELPWAQITTLIIARDIDRDLMSYIHALRQCPSLQTLQVEFCYPQDQLFAIEDKSFMVPLLTLRRLDIAIDHLMDHLMVPQLEELHLEVDQPSSYEAGKLSGIIHSLHKLVWRSCALTITSLQLKKIPLSEELIAVLSLTTNLATLDIRAKMSRRDGIHDTVGEKTIMSLLAKLHVQSTDPPFLPKLCHLSIGLSKHLNRVHFPYLREQDDLVKTLQSRWNEGRPAGVERLRTFRFGIYAQWLDEKHKKGDFYLPIELHLETAGATGFG